MAHRITRQIQRSRWHTDPARWITHRSSTAYPARWIQQIQHSISNVTDYSRHTQLYLHQGYAWVHLTCFEPVYVPKNGPIPATRGIKGYQMGSDLGVNLSVFDPIPVPLTRARAYNDCAKDAVLLKTASKWLQAEVSRAPKWTPFWVLKDGTSRW